MSTATLPHYSNIDTRSSALKLAFVGVGWIGRNRMEAMLEHGGVEAAAIADPVDALVAKARGLAPEATCHANLDALLAGAGSSDLDGLVIATPSALHADQTLRALEAGRAVFCQKPLGRTAGETRRVIEAARRADRLLGVDLSYRHVEGARRIRELMQDGAIGSVYAVDLVFHNAWGPDGDWFYDPQQAGGGCVIDLGIHLVDLALWTLDWPDVEHVTSRLFHKGTPLPRPDEQIEDYATVRLDLAGGTSARLACSWNLPAGRDAVIEATFYGTEGGLTLRNVDGSYYDFVAERYDGTATETLVEPPDAWGGRAAVAWAEQLAESPRYDDAIEHAVTVAEVIDRIYGR